MYIRHSLAARRRESRFDVLLGLFDSRSSRSLDRSLPPPPLLLLLALLLALLLLLLLI